MPLQTAEPIFSEIVGNVLLKQLLRNQDISMEPSILGRCILAVVASALIVMSAADNCVIVWKRLAAAKDGNLRRALAHHLGMCVIVFALSSFLGYSFVRVMLHKVEAKYEMGNCHGFQFCLFLLKAIANGTVVNGTELISGNSSCS